MNKRILVIGFDPSDELLLKFQDMVIFLDAGDLKRVEDLPAGIKAVFLDSSLIPGEKWRICKLVEERKITRLAVIYKPDDLVEHLEEFKRREVMATRPKLPTATVPKSAGSPV